MGRLLFNPIYAITVPILFLCTVPLAVFASITTTLACVILIYRVLVIYFEIVLALLPWPLFGLSAGRLGYHPNSPATATRLDSRTDGSPSPVLSPHSRRRRRRLSSGSGTRPEAGSLVGIGEGGLGLTPSIGAERDFEGIGGWRTGDDESWTTMNSRLEMPDRHHNRNHYRSASGGLMMPGDGSFVMMKGRTRSPESAPVKSRISSNSSRARTPTGPRITPTGKGHNEGYFPLTVSPRAAKKSTAGSVE